MFASLRARLLFSYITVMGVTLCIVATTLLFILLSSPLPSRQTYQRLEDIGQASLPTLRSSSVDMDSRLTAIATSTGVRILRSSHDRKILFDSDNLIKPGQSLDIGSMQEQAPDIRRGTYIDSQERTWLVVALNLPQP